LVALVTSATPVTARLGPLDRAMFHLASELPLDPGRAAMNSLTRWDNR
jgi:hypothetical protein